MKRVWSLVALTGFLVLGTSAPAHAGSILYFWDFNIAYDSLLGPTGQHERMSEALNDVQVTSQHTVTFANTLTEFNNGVDSGNYDLFILFLQQTPADSSDAAVYTTAFNKVATAVANGKRAIVDDWGGGDVTPIDGFTPFTNTHLENGFGTDYTGKIGGVAAQNVPPFVPADPTDSFTVQRPSLLFNMGPDPVVVSLYDPGWLVPFSGLTVPVGSTCAAYFSSAGQDCAIVFGNNDRTIVNGFMNDTFRVNEQGKQLYINEINTLLPTPVPEPTSLVLIGTGLAAAAARLRRRSKQ